MRLRRKTKEHQTELEINQMIKDSGIENDDILDFH